MKLGGGGNRPLGVVLVEQGLVTGDDIDGALTTQAETSQPLGEILVQRSLIARPMLAKALAAQRGRTLEEEGGFGSGLMAKIEQLHLMRRGLHNETGSEQGQEAAAAEIDEPLALEVPEGQPELLRQHETEFDARERELQELKARLARLEHELETETAKAAPAKPAA